MQAAPSDLNPGLRTEDLGRSPRPTAGEKLCSGSDLRGTANLAGIEEGPVKAMRDAAAITVLERRRGGEEDGRLEQQLRLSAALTSSLHAQPPLSSLHTSHGAASGEDEVDCFPGLTRTRQVNARHAAAAGGTNPPVTSPTFTCSSPSSLPITIRRYASLVHVTRSHPSDTNPGLSSPASAAVTASSLLHGTSSSRHESVTHATVTHDTNATAVPPTFFRPIHGGTTRGKAAAAGVRGLVGFLGDSAGSHCLSGVSGINGSVTIVDDDVVVVEDDFSSSLVDADDTAVGSTFPVFLPLPPPLGLADPFLFGLLAAARVSAGAGEIFGEPAAEAGLGAIGRYLSMICPTFHETSGSRPTPYMAMQQPPLLSISTTLLLRIRATEG
ncbi:hypothetical protein BHE74_00034080 [Ensete ventricosum]|nr:hypothetical protein BHE74_00034080 [Ensete ventricosum]